jgi:hypothetical protein
VVIKTNGFEIHVGRLCYRKWGINTISSPMDWHQGKHGVRWQAELLTSSRLKFLSPSQSPGFLRSHGLKSNLTSTGFGLHTTQLKLTGESMRMRLKSGLRETFGLSGIKVPESSRDQFQFIALLHRANELSLNNSYTLNLYQKWVTLLGVKIRCLTELKVLSFNNDNIISKFI